MCRNLCAGIYVPEFMCRNLCAGIYVPEFICRNLCAGIYVPEFMCRNLCAGIYVPEFICRNLCAGIYVPEFMFRNLCAGIYVPESPGSCRGQPDFFAIAKNSAGVMACGSDFRRSAPRYGPRQALPKDAGRFPGLMKPGFPQDVVGDCQLGMVGGFLRVPMGRSGRGRVRSGCGTRLRRAGPFRRPAGGPDRGAAAWERCWPLLAAFGRCPGR